MNAGRALISQARAIADNPLLPIDKATGHTSTREFVRVLADAIEQRDAIIDRLIVFLGPGPQPCSNGWHWIYASRDVLEPLTAAEVDYFTGWTYPLDRDGQANHNGGTSHTPR